MTRRASIVLIASLLALLPYGARAQTSGSGVAVSPSRIEPSEPLFDRKFAADVTFTNKKSSPVHLEISLKEIWQALDGAAVFKESSIISGAFTASVSSLDLAPGEARAVHVSGTIPSSRQAAYVGVIGEEVSQPGSTVEVHTDHASLLLLRGPKPWDERISITDIGFTNGGKTVYATVKNIGGVHLAPAGTVTIKKGNVVVGTVHVGAQRSGSTVTGQVLPTCDGGCSRRYQAEWRPRAGLIGPLTLVGNFTSPPARLTLSVPFAQAEAQRQPAAAIAFTKVTPAEIVVSERNTGTVTLQQPAIQLQALQDAKFSRDLKVFPEPDLKPGATKTEKWHPTLQDGRYKIVGRVLLGTEIKAEAQTDLTIGSVEPAGAAKLGTGVAVVALILLVVTGAFVVFLLRRRRAA
ncbi:MAG: hypothetical protein LC663_05335 [Actinobacteria bacterium]|nr:hypothetical protein [Actinomycetota bacterium]